MTTKTPAIEQLKKLLPQCLLPDQVRIGQRLARGLSPSPGSDAAHLPVELWLAEARASIEVRQARASVARHLQYPPALPITARASCSAT